jgi:hypothetical protein
MSRETVGHSGSTENESTTDGSADTVLNRRNALKLGGATGLTMVGTGAAMGNADGCPLGCESDEPEICVNATDRGSCNSPDFGINVVAEWWNLDDLGYETTGIGILYKDPDEDGWEFADAGTTNPGDNGCSVFELDIAPTKDWEIQAIATAEDGSDPAIIEDTVSFERITCW